MASAEMIADDSEEKKSDQKNSDTFCPISEQEKNNSSVIQNVVLSPHGHLKKRTEDCFRNLPGLPPPPEDHRCNGNVNVCCIVPSSDNAINPPSTNSKLMNGVTDNNEQNSFLINCQNNILKSENTFTPFLVEPNHTSKVVSVQSVDDKHKYDHVQEKEIKSGTVYEIFRRTFNYKIVKNRSLFTS